MENYILRIYRRDEENPHKIAGTLEFVGKDEKKNFSSFEELKDILNCKNNRLLRNHESSVRRPTRAE